MQAARRHPISLVVALGAGFAVGLIGALADWSTVTVYLALLALVIGLGAFALGGEQRRKGRSDRSGTSASPRAARGR